MTTTWFTNLKTTAFSILLVKTRAGLTGVRLEGQRDIERDASWREDASVFATETRQLQEYFAGERTQFDLELAPRGTPFQLRVWRALAEVPFGVTTSYAAIARAIGKPTASRAVGAANGQNAHAIIVPCHRIIGANRELVGYASGLSRKRWLLDHERRVHLRRYTLMMGTPSCVST